MKNAISFYHDINTILTTNDGRMFTKKSINGSNQWVDISSHFFKSEYINPTNDIGVVGDYFGRYIRKNNQLKYSEDFNSSIWTKKNISLTKESRLSFPTNPSTKMTSNTINGQHSLETTFVNNNKVFTFSIYALKNELKNISIKITNPLETFGYRTKANLELGTIVLEPIGEQTNILYKNGGIEQWSGNIYRIWVSVQIEQEYNLKAKINLCDNLGDEVFSSPNTSYGIFINGSQLVNSMLPESYLYSNGLESTMLELKTLYKKDNEGWKETAYKVHYFNGEPLSTIGNVGDIGFKQAFLELSPIIKVGNSTNLQTTTISSKWVWNDESKNWEEQWYEKIVPTNIEGVLYFNGNTGKYYIVTKNGHQSLEYFSPSNTKNILMSISLNQQTYQTWCRGNNFSPLQGFNTGGCYNFWRN